VVGFGFGSDVRPADMLVIPIGGGSERVTTTRELGGVDVTLEPDEAPFDRIGFYAFWTFTLEPNETAALLIFTAGGRIPDIVNLNVDVEQGSLTAATSRMGSGSSVLNAADPADEGLAAGAGPAAAGRSTHREQTHAGIAGGFPGVGFCGACDIEWKGPGGRADRWTAVSSDHLVHEPIVSVGSSLFSGPGGGWEWTISGAGAASFAAELTRSPAYGAYAPIGADWTLFRSD
jgi:hypothetical protein